MKNVATETRGKQGNLYSLFINFFIFSEFELYIFQNQLKFNMKITVNLIILWSSQEYPGNPKKFEETRNTLITFPLLEKNKSKQTFLEISQNSTKIKN